MTPPPPPPVLALWTAGGADEDVGDGARGARGGFACRLEEEAAQDAAAAAAAGRCSGLRVGEAKPAAEFVGAAAAQAARTAAQAGAGAGAAAHLECGVGAVVQLGQLDPLRVAAPAQPALRRLARVKGGGEVRYGGGGVADVEADEAQIEQGLGLYLQVAFTQ